MTRQQLTRVLCTTLVLVGLMACATAVKAQGWAYGPWYSLYPADFTSLYRTGRIPVPPYFAIHPPVYYSCPVPRTYGYSPWAYPPYVKTPDIELPPLPKMVPNKYVPQKEPAKPAAERVTRAPVTIVNPYVIRTAKAEGERPEAAARERKPQVVYPVAAFHRG